MTEYIFFTQRLFIPLTTLYLTLYLYQHVIGLSHHISVSSNKEKIRYGTSGCVVPPYWKSFKFVESKTSRWNSCGIRAVKIEKPHINIIRYVIDEKKVRTILGNHTYECCHQFAFRSNNSGEEDNAIEYTPCIKFRNNETAVLKHEVIKVTCRRRRRHTRKSKIYEDVYIVLKKLKPKQRKKNDNSWNILLLGMDTMSRMRAYRSIPKTVKYFKNNKWLDYRNFLKAAGSTFQNIMNLLTGKGIFRLDEICGQGMSNCNDLIIWSQFKKRGYITAYGEDNLKSSDTFSRYNGFKVPPTDHYLRPLYLTGENNTGNIVCTKKKPSALHLLDYAHQFATAYKTEKFFGVFWINSYSHNANSIPTLLQQYLIDFFEKLNKAGVLKKTIIIFFSDHGIRFGNTRIPVESYYDDRLPMLFMWIPHSFQERFKTEYRNLYLNQYRLTTHYDLHSTLWDILKLSNTSIHIIPPEACPQCRSLFEEKYENRSCEDMNVDAKWCICHVLKKVFSEDIAATIIPQIALFFLNSKAKKIDTESCYKCSKLKLEAILRHHWYRDKYNVTYYIVAFQVAQGAAQFEATIVMHNDQIKILDSIEPISEYKDRYKCALSKNDHAYCVCEYIELCSDDADFNRSLENEIEGSI